MSVLPISRCNGPGGLRNKMLTVGFSGGSAEGQSSARSKSTCSTNHIMKSAVSLCALLHAGRFRVLDVGLFGLLMFMSYRANFTT